MKKLFLLIALAISLPLRADIGTVKDEVRGDLRIDFVSSPATESNEDHGVDKELRRVVALWLINHPNVFIVDVRLSESASGTGSSGGRYSYRQARVMIIYREKFPQPEASDGKDPR